MSGTGASKRKKKREKRKKYSILKVRSKNMSVIYTELTLKNEDDAALVEKGLIKKDEFRQMTVVG